MPKAKRYNKKKRGKTRENPPFSPPPINRPTPVITRRGFQRPMRL